MVEKIIEELKEKIVSDMPAQIATINSQMNDSLLISTIPKGSIYLYESESYQNYPNITIVPRKTNPNYHQNAKTPEHLILVGCSVTNTNEVLLTKSVLRYLIVLRRILEANDFLRGIDTIDGTILQVLVETYEYEQMRVNEKTEYLKEFFILLKAQERLLMNT